jgi:hypothetical protein
MFKMKVTFKNAPGVESVYSSESSDFNEIISINSVAEKWGLAERPELDEMGQPTGVILPAEYMIEIEDITDQVAQDAINAEALAYLASTDWLVIREVDAGVACPAEIKAERAAARARIVR